MKKVLWLTVGFLLIFLVVIGLTAAPQLQDATGALTLEINGDSNIYVEYGNPFEDPGATATYTDKLDNTSVAVPEIYFSCSDSRVALLGMGFIEGTNVLSPSYLFKSKAKKKAFAEEVIGNLLEIHSVKGEKYGSLLNPTYDSWTEYYEKEHIIPKMQGLKDLCSKGKYSKKSYALLEKAAEIYKEKALEPDCPVLIHGDINIMNIMADPKTMKLRGFIDPAGYIYADREYDLFQLLNMWGNSFYLYETYKKHYPLSENADFRIAFYGALNEASCRLTGGLIMPLWEILCNRRLKKELNKLNR